MGTDSFSSPMMVFILQVNECVKMFHKLVSLSTLIPMLSDGMPLPPHHCHPHNHHYHHHNHHHNHHYHHYNHHHHHHYHHHFGLLGTTHQYTRIRSKLFCQDIYVLGHERMSPYQQKSPFLVYILTDTSYLV